MSNTAFIAAELRPADATEAVIFAEEDFVAELQSIIHCMMADKGVSRSDLAKLLGVSKPRVTQYFAGDGSNLTARTIARIFHALGEQAEVVCQWSARKDATLQADQRQRSITAAGGRVTDIGKWCRQENWGGTLEGVCEHTTDVSAFVAAYRARPPIAYQQAA
jgi:predicted transcriptional regulator